MLKFFLVLRYCLLTLIMKIYNTVCNDTTSHIGLFTIYYNFQHFLTFISSHEFEKKVYIIIAHRVDLRGANYAIFLFLLLNSVITYVRDIYFDDTESRGMRRIEELVYSNIITKRSYYGRNSSNVIRENYRTI